MDSGNNQTLNGWNVKYLQMRRLKLQQQQQLRKNQQLQEESKPITKPVPVALPVSESSRAQNKKLSSQQVISKGRIIKIIEKTLNANEYKVQCQYESQIIELIAFKDQIIKNNHIPMLDYYQKTLGLR